MVGLLSPCWVVVRWWLDGCSILCVMMWRPHLFTHTGNQGRAGDSAQTPLREIWLGPMTGERPPCLPVLHWHLKSCAGPDAVCRSQRRGAHINGVQVMSTTAAPATITSLLWSQKDTEKLSSAVPISCLLAQLFFSKKTLYDVFILKLAIFSQRVLEY